MKISIIGTHGSGKSTLSYLLASHYKTIGRNIKIIQKVARSCPFPINQEMSKESAIWIYLEHSRKELEAEKKFDIVIGDRSVYDSFVYAQYFNIDDKNLKDLEDLAFSQLKSYQKIIFVRPDIPLQTDGTRDPSIEFQTRIDQLFYSKIVDIPHVEIKSSQIFDQDQQWKSICL